MRQRFNANIKAKAKKFWHRSPRFAKTRTVDPSLPSKKFLAISEGFSRQQTTLAIHLRTGHIQLNKNLHRMRLIESPICPACQGQEETVFHFLMQCPAYQIERHLLRAKMGPDAISIHKLLATRKGLKQTFKYIARTKRFKKRFEAVDENLSSDDERDS
jgi:hypothetical protein